MRRFTLMLLLCVLTGLCAFAQYNQGSIIQETTAPATPSAGFGRCWFDATDHAFECVNSSGVRSRATTTSVATLPTAATAQVGLLYRWTGATATNSCPAAGAGGSGGSATALCITHNGSTWQAVLQTDGAGNFTIGTTVLRSVPLTGLVAHYSADAITGADGSTVTTFPDVSGNGYHATKAGAGTVTLAKAIRMGHNAVRMAKGQAAYFTFPSVSLAASPNLSVFLIGRNDGYFAPTVPVSVGTPTGNADVCLLLYGSAGTTGQWKALWRGAYSPQVFSVHSGYNLMGLVQNGAVLTYINNGDAQQTTVTTSATVYMGGAIGARSDGNYQASWDISEVLVYNRTLTASEILDLQRYAASQYGITITPTLNVLVLGNSLSSGTGVLDWNNYPNQLVEKLPMARVYNTGQPGL